jgi:hypothetical protein
MVGNKQQFKYKKCKDVLVKEKSASRLGEEAERRLNRLPVISSGIGDLTNLPIVSGFNHLSPNL